MLTLITGTPGAGKSLYAVWNFARPVPGSVVEQSDQSLPAVNRVLYSNIKDLLVEHIKIDADALNTWHEWAKPGAVILYDEVQEVWRARAFGSKVPECIMALETHRHLGVDIVLVTQHPMLIDPNIRRLVNQHLHLRRITKTVAMCYEWDHCENPGNTRTCVASKVFMHPKKAYSLYKSAQLHTKPTVRIPAIAYFGLLALGGLAYAGPLAYERMSGALGKVSDVAKSPNEKTTTRIVNGEKITETVTLADGSKIVPRFAPGPFPGASAPVIPGEVVAQALPVVSGCVQTRKACACMDVAGVVVDVEPGFCEAHILGHSEPGQKADLAVLADPPDPARFVGDLDTLAFMSRRR
ncbi:MAG: zonular occludens toxin domain-containing protein [Rhodoferax sp.]|uniref:zonular occludens toxin domain-containing protein n=1 Tax=Rhodoferax sp. TaxID=50421 RepID=UPI0027272AFC|nr:zonular occludens toxin domain-containing protein [Rhodoferax sp.]MDO8447547.1 zonular occludens toxin domain-containing protein [Rhodoferax sp.]